MNLAKTSNLSRAATDVERSPVGLLKRRIFSKGTGRSGFSLTFFQLKDEQALFQPQRHNFGCSPAALSRLLQQQQGHPVPTAGTVTAWERDKPRKPQNVPQQLTPEANSVFGARAPLVWD